MNSTLEAMVRVLFQSWFVDFDPVRAKLDGRQLPGLDPTTTALLRERLISPCVQKSLAQFGSRSRTSATILDAFYRMCARPFEQGEAIHAQSRTLASLRDTLLPKLLRGEIRFSDTLSL
ncbi:MAG: hypothetical protein U0984_06515 [Prosthecobacter sp.]|nr:hypothetical protein [Prosthecobacter sp.]